MSERETPETPASDARPSGGGGSTSSEEGLKAAVIEVLKTVYDPEIPVDIYELGLIYEVEVEDPGSVRVKMTLTSPACPVAGSLPGEVEAKVRGVDGVTDAKIDLVWEPPWDMEMMSDAAKVKLGFF